MALLLSLGLCLPAGRARAADPAEPHWDACTVTPGQTVLVTYPELSYNQNLDFWQIPWKAGDKLNGSIQLQVQTPEPLPNLTIHMVGGAAAMDNGSRRFIAANHVVFTRADSGAPPADGKPQVDNGKAYVFNFIADEIPGEDTYCAHLEAVWGEAGHLSREPLPSLKLKAYGDAIVRVLSGQQLQAQWTNLDAPLNPFKLLQPMVVQDDVYFNRYNPEPTLIFTMPGNPSVSSTQEFAVQVALDPVLDEHNTPTPNVLFWIERGQSPRPVAGEAVQILKIGINDSFRIHIFRRHVNRDGQVVSADRIPPGKYHTNLTITTPWGTRQEPVEIAVRDAPLWPAVTLIAGVLVSLLAAHWERRQPMYRAQLKARRWRRFYILQGLKLFLVEAVLARINLAVAARDVPDATREADLLENLLRSLPDTLIVDGVIQGLLTLPQVSPTMIAAEVSGAGTVAEAHDRLAAFCAASGDPAVQEIAAPLALKSRYSGAKPLPLAEVKPLEWLRWGVREWLYELFIGVRRSATWLTMPSMWDTVTMVVFFVLLNGGMIALQMVEAYGPNATFGSSADYLSLLFWGFAGDTTRKKLTDLAGKVLPSDHLPVGVNAPSPTTPPATPPH
jgi:hypothetical protein